MSVEGTQPAVAGLPATHETRVSAPVAGSRRNVITASSSVPAATTVAPSGETTTAEARARPPIGVQSAYAPSLRQPDAGRELRERPGRDVALERRQRAGGRGDVERRPVGRDRDRRGRVDAADRRAAGAVGAQAARGAGQGREAAGRGVAREHGDGVGAGRADVDEAPVRRDGDGVGAGQGGGIGAARRERGRDAARRCPTSCTSEPFGWRDEARDRAGSRGRDVDVQAVGRDGDARWRLRAHARRRSRPARSTSGSRR